MARLFWQLSYFFVFAGRSPATINTCNWNNVSQQTSRLATAITQALREESERENEGF